MSLDIEGNERDVLYEFARDSVRGALRILDCACGPGEGAAIIAKGVPESSVEGIDLSKDLIKSAGEKFRLPNLRFSLGSALALPYPDASFDAVVSCHTLEHFTEEDQKRFLSELRRVLVKGGKLVIATPDREVWNLLGIAGQQEDHIRELAQKEFLEMVRAAGFEVDSVLGQSPLKEGSFPLRRFLNALKHMDVFRLRRLLGGSLQSIDKQTQPIAREVKVVPLSPHEKASTTVLVAHQSI